MQRHNAGRTQGARAILFTPPFHESRQAMRNLLFGFSILFATYPTAIIAQEPKEPREPRQIGVQRTEDPELVALLQQILKRLEVLEAKAAPTVAQGATRPADWVGGEQDPFAAARKSRPADPFAPNAQSPVLQPAPAQQGSPLHDQTQLPLRTSGSSKRSGRTQRTLATRTSWAPRAGKCSPSFNRIVVPM